MKNPIKVKIESVHNYGTQFHQNHYALQVRVLDVFDNHELLNGQRIKVNMWLSKKEVTLNEQLTNAGNRDYTGANATIDIRENKGFYNCNAIEFDDPNVYRNEK